jgi:hypothetical protein
MSLIALSCSDYLPQAINRVHRIGQEYPCKVTHLQVELSVDEALMLLQKTKRAQAKLPLDGIGTVHCYRDSSLSIQDVQNIVSALESAYHPVIVANPHMFPEHHEKVMQVHQSADCKQSTSTGSLQTGRCIAPPNIPTQLRLIVQQPNGPLWIRVCAKLGITPSLQQVHQYDAALKLVIDNGHQPSEEIYTCIVSEQQRHVIQQQLQRNQKQCALVMSKPPSLDVHKPPEVKFQSPPAPVANSNYAETSYAVRKQRFVVRCDAADWVQRLQDGSSYSGEFKDGKFHGNGVFTFAIGGYYSGQW